MDRVQQKLSDVAAQYETPATPRERLRAHQLYCVYHRADLPPEEALEVAILQSLRVTLPSPYQ